MNHGFEIPILTYHSIDSSGSVISVAPEVFRKQMETLRQSSTRVLALRDLVVSLRQNQKVENAVAITFDDGFKNIFTDAFPLLKEFGFRPTVFLVTNFCGKDNRWYGQPERIPKLDLMNWDQIAQASEFVDFGVHTANHPDLTGLPASQLEDEITRSAETLRQQIGAREQAFAYPYGKTTPGAKQLVEKHFFAACSTELDFATPSSDLYFLPRVDMYYFSANESFSVFGTPAFRRHIRFRGLLRRVREAVTK